MYAMVVFGGGGRCPGSKCWVTLDDSKCCSRPTVLGHARCLRYWQPAKVHKAASIACSSWLTAKTSSFSWYVIDAHGDGYSAAASTYNVCITYDRRQNTIRVTYRAFQKKVTGNRKSIASRRLGDPIPGCSVGPESARREANTIINNL